MSGGACRRWSESLLVLLTLSGSMLGGCRQPAPVTPAVTVRDSGGVAIVGLAPARLDVPLRRLELLSGALGARLDSLTLGRPNGVAASDSLGILIGDDGFKHVLVVPLRDGAIRALGEEGSGPGEFMHLQLLGATTSGGIVVFDAVNQRITTLQASGRVSGIRTLGEVGWGALFARAVTGDGSVVLSSSGALPPPVAAGTVRPRTELRRLPDGDPAAAVSLGTYRGREIVWKIGGPDGTTMGEAPFGQDLLVAASDSITAFTENDLPEIHLIGTDGRLRRIVRIEVDPRPVREHDRRDYRESVASRAAGFEEEWKLRTSDDVFPVVFPPFTGILLDSADQLWVFLRPDEGQDDATGLVLGLDGMPRFVVRFPANMTPRAILDDQVVGTVEREDGAIGVEVTATSHY